MDNQFLRQGWLSSLRDSEDSNWGTPEGLFEAIQETENAAVFRIESEVWGRILRNNNDDPQEGDGFAFYHSKKARFPKGDPYKRRPRISLVGTLQEIEIVEKRNVTYISVDIDPVVRDALQRHPIIRDETTEEFFLRCNVRQGPVASFYPVTQTDWKLLESWVDERLKGQR